MVYIALCLPPQIISCTDLSLTYYAPVTEDKPFLFPEHYTYCFLYLEHFLYDFSYVWLFPIWIWKRIFRSEITFLKEASPYSA